MRVLLSGDLHLGRSSSRVALPAADGAVLRAASAWERLVELAIRERVLAVCLSGDIADKDNKFWEAIGPLEAGIGRLSEAGIWTVAVSGNHDFDVLPRLADGLSEQARARFLLPGRGGAWERVTIRDGQGRAVLHVDGWCFAQERVRESPLREYALDPPGDGVPVLGMVHGDLGVTESVYAPLSLSDLMRAGPAGWLLGHIHAPRLERGAGAAGVGSCWVLYPGSLQALDPGETGGHGPWMLELEHGRLSEPHPVQLSSVWYESVEVAVDGLAEVGDVRDRVFRVCGERAEALISEVGVPPEHVVFRVVLTGRSGLGAALDRGVMDEGQGDTRVPVGRTGAGRQIERLENRTLPSLDLYELARLETAPGVLARLLLALGRGGELGAGAMEAGGGMGGGSEISVLGAEAGGRDLSEQFAEVERLMSQVQMKVRDVEGLKVFAGIRGLEEAGPDEASMRELLSREASKLLGQLVSQRT